MHRVRTLSALSGAIVIAVVAILSIAIGAGGSGALNMWYDADIDSLMARTAQRPVPTGSILPGEA